MAIGRTESAQTNSQERAIVGVFTRLETLGNNAEHLAQATEGLCDRMTGSQPREVGKAHETADSDGMIQILHKHIERIEGQLERLSLALKTCDETA